MVAAMRIDTHHHLIPPDYRKRLLATSAAECAGLAFPDWSLQTALEAMSVLTVDTAIMSVSTPGTTFLPDADDAAALAWDVNDYAAGVVADDPTRFGFFATVPMPHVDLAVAEAVRALDNLHADGVVLLANNSGTYLGAEGQDDLFAVLDERSATAFVHPNVLPGPTVPGIPPFATDFLLDTTRAAYLLVRNGIRRRYPQIKFILSHAGGFVPYAAHRMAMGMLVDAPRDPAEILAEFSSFYFDTALSSSPSALPSLLAFADPGHVIYGSDWPFAPLPAAQYFTNGLDTFDGLDDRARSAIDHLNVRALLPRFAGQS
jgi:6-methylsalicylate decarboxylase